MASARMNKKGRQRKRERVNKMEDTVCVITIQSGVHLSDLFFWSLRPSGTIWKGTTKVCIPVIVIILGYSQRSVIIASFLINKNLKAPLIFWVVEIFYSCFPSLRQSSWYHFTCLPTCLPLLHDSLLYGACLFLSKPSIPHSFMILLTTCFSAKFHYTLFPRNLNYFYYSKSILNLSMKILLFLQWMVSFF